MQRNLSMNQIGELLRLKYELKLKHRQIAASLGIGAGTVSVYLQKARLAGLSWPLPEESTEALLHERLFGSRLLKPVTKALTEPNWSYIVKERCRKGVTLQLLWKEYSEAHPKGLSYSQFCRHYQGLQKQLDPVMRFTHKAGENCFVDYAGLTLSFVDVSTGTSLTAQIFVACLGASSYTYVEACLSQSLRDWLMAHVRLFTFFGGVPQNCVPDNLKAGVSKAHRYDPEINLSYQHFAEYYGVAILPARAYKPRDKAKVENAVLHVERHILAPLRDRIFTSLSEINRAILPLLTAYNAKPFQKIEGSRLSLFEAIDKPALKALPATAYEWTEWKEAKVHVDYHIVYEKHGYSVPYTLIGKLLKIRATATTIECYHDLKRVALHPRLYQGTYSTLPAHMPIAHQQQSQGSIEDFLNQAKLVGPHTQAYLEALIKHRAFPQQSFRACQGILRLGKHYGANRLEKACEKALVLRAYRYKDIEAFLRNGLEDALVAPASVPSTLHENIRGSGYYQ